MGERPVVKIARRLQRGESIDQLTDIPQTAVIRPRAMMPSTTEDEHNIVLASHEECLQHKSKQAENFRHIEEESNKYHAKRLWQSVGEQVIVVNPPYPPMTEAEIDASFDLPYTRMPHPRYKGGEDDTGLRDDQVLGQPAPGLFRRLCLLHHLGPPGQIHRLAIQRIDSQRGETNHGDARFQRLSERPGRPLGQTCTACTARTRSCATSAKRPSCLAPKICPNLNADHSALLDIYRAVDALPGIKKSFIGSGVRYDLLLHRHQDEALNRCSRRYTEELIARHVSGRLKVAPEHTSDRVLAIMRKPSFSLFEEFKRLSTASTVSRGSTSRLSPTSYRATRGVPRRIWPSWPL